MTFSLSNCPILKTVLFNLLTDNILMICIKNGGSLQKEIPGIWLLLFEVLSHCCCYTPSPNHCKQHTKALKISQLSEKYTLATLDYPES